MAGPALELPLLNVTAEGCRISGMHLVDFVPNGGSSMVQVSGEDFTLENCLIHVAGAAHGLGDYHAIRVASALAPAPRRGTLVQGNSFVFAQNAQGVVGFSSEFGTSLRLLGNQFGPDPTAAVAAIRSAITLRNEEWSTITGNTFLSINAPVEAAPENSIIASISEGAFEGHHCVISANYFERIRAHSVVCLAGGKFVTLVGNAFGRSSAPYGIVRITGAEPAPLDPGDHLQARDPGANPGARTKAAGAGTVPGVQKMAALGVPRSNLIAGNQFHNVTIGPEASQRAIQVEEHGGLLSITNNQFNWCGQTQIQLGLLGSLIEAVQITGNQFESACTGANIPQAIRISAGQNMLVGSNTAYRNADGGCTWDQVYSLDAGVAPPVDDGANRVL